MANETTSEASPLLKRPGDADASRSQSSDEVVRESMGKDDQSKTHPNGVGTEQFDGESQNDGERAQQFEGMPDVKKRLKYILPAVGIGIFLAAADQTIIVSCYGKIGSDLEALNKSSWIATSYFLTLTSFQPLYGKLSDIFGRKEALLFAYTIFGLGCLLCGLARTMDGFIAARAFAGIGGGGMTTVVSILMSDIVPLRERGTWQGIINIIYASGQWDPDKLLHDHCRIPYLCLHLLSPLPFAIFNTKPLLTPYDFKRCRFRSTNWRSPR